jgi:hypothetical protein
MSYVVTTRNDEFVGGGEAKEGGGSIHLEAEGTSPYNILNIR